MTTYRFTVIGSPLAVSRRSRNRQRLNLPLQDRQAQPAILGFYFRGLLTLGDGRRACLQRSLGRFFFFPRIDLFHKGIDHFVLEDVANDLAALEDDALALAGGDAEIGL